MSGILGNLRTTLLLSLVLALVVVLGYGFHTGAFEGGMDWGFAEAVTRWVHVVLGILWIGLLYYFNFVQIRVMPDIPVELKPAVTKFIAPEALFWFRWAALLTVLSGVLLAWLRGYLLSALQLGADAGFADPKVTFIGLGMWLALIMFVNVWLVIWPNQRVALGMVERDAEAKARAAKTAMLFSRINTLLSLPMLATMAMNQTLFG